MRFIKPAELDGLERISPVTWRQTDDEGSFVIDVPPDALPFICFFVQADADQAAPKAAFDIGQGFDDLTAVAFRPFPLAFYHVSLAKIGAVRRIRFRACLGAGARFRCVVFQSARPVFVAVLHYLFNLRYQKIGLVAPTDGGKVGALAYVRSNAARIRTFFATVSAGGGLRVQQAEDDVLENLRLWQSREAEPVQAAMRERLAANADMPLVSFVSPAYDTRPDYLRDLLAPSGAHEAPSAELSLADDGSTSPATRTALADAEAIPGVRVVALAQNSGIAVATNAGIAAARGEWVGFIDHDDAVIIIWQESIVAGPAVAACYDGDFPFGHS